MNDGFAGYWSDSTTQDEAATATGVNAAQMYVVVTSGSDLGIFSSSLLNWKFPKSTDFPNSTLIELEDLVTNPGTAGNALAASAQIIFGSGVFYNGAGESFLKLATVPEPSTAMLVGAGLLGLVGLRRRSSK